MLALTTGARRARGQQRLAIARRHSHHVAEGAERDALAAREPRSLGLDITGLDATLDGQPVFAGVIADAVDKRRLVILTQSLMLVQALVLAALWWRPKPPLLGQRGTTAMSPRVTSPVSRVLATAGQPPAPLPPSPKTYLDSPQHEIGRAHV